MPNPICKPMRGAEAVVRRKKLLGCQCIVKSRIAKTYRVKELDERLRIERTRSEARLLNKAKLAGVACPTVLEVEEDNFAITMTFIAGKRPEMSVQESCKAGELLAKLHGSNIIHGDYTPANLIVANGKPGAGKHSMSVIDLGLGFLSTDVEDKAVDVFTMLRALGKNQKTKDAFVDGYKKNYADYAAVLKRLGAVEKRVRYA